MFTRNGTVTILNSTIAGNHVTGGTADHPGGAGGAGLYALSDRRSTKLR